MRRLLLGMILVVLLVCSFFFLLLVSQSSGGNDKMREKFFTKSIVQPASTSTTLFMEDFEGSFPGTNWWVGDDDPNSGNDYWDDTYHRVYGGYGSCWCADIGSKPDGTPNTDTWTYDNDMKTYLSRRNGAPFDAASWDIAFLTYRVWYYIQSDHDELDLSVTGDGSNYGGIFQYTDNTLTDGDWYLTGYSGGWEYRIARVPESTSAGEVYTSSFNIGYYFQSDSSVYYEGAYLDDLAFTVYDITTNGVGVSKNETDAGDTIILGYKIDNITPYYLKIWLGATLIDPNGNPIYDPSNDKLITVSPGLNWYYRNFQIPSSASPGTYDITYAIWSGWTSPLSDSRQWWIGTWEDSLNVIDAHIVDFDVEEGTYYPGDTVDAQAMISNDAECSYTFTIDYAIRDTDGHYWEVYHEDREIPAGTSLVLTDELDWVVPDDVAGGDCDGRLMVLDPSDGSTYDVEWDNQGPTVNHYPVLSNGHVDPTVGYPDTEFTFEVTYQDEDGDAPGTRRHLYVYDSKWGWVRFDMDYISGDPESGELYRMLLRGPSGGWTVQDHKYFFHFNDAYGAEGWYPPDQTYLTFTVKSFPSKVLDITHQVQHKDTKMLCLGNRTHCCPINGDFAWNTTHPIDAPHPTGDGLDDKYCARASISTIVSYYDGQLSQDRISYYYFEERSEAGDGKPEGDLGYGRGMWAKETLKWALNDATITEYNGKPSFSKIEEWIESNRPVYVRCVRNDQGNESRHGMVIDGYDADGKLVHVLDPWYVSTDLRAKVWRDYSSFESIYGTIEQMLVPPTSAEARSDEDWNNNGIPDTMEDYDFDGVCDFDEMYRFFTDLDNPDSDGDGVPDKAEIISYTFLSDRSFDVDDLRRPNPDGDNDRCELDFDSDNGGVRDGLEDKNGNGFVEPTLGETDPLDPSDDPNTVHLESREDSSNSSNLGSIEFDGSNYSLPNDVIKPFGTYSIRYIAGSGYVFHRWETTNGVSVVDPNAESTAATVNGTGTLTAIYNASAPKFVHGYSLIKIHHMLGGQASMFSGIFGNSALISLCFGLILSFLKGKHRRRNRILLVCAVVCSLLLLTVAAHTVLMRYLIHSTGTIKYPPKLVVYVDSECFNETSFIDWGLMLPASTNDVTLYLRNVGNIQITLSVNTSNWNPSETAFFAALSCNYTGQILDPGAVTEVEFTLDISENIGDTDVEDFMFDIIICVHESV